MTDLLQLGIAFILWSQSLYPPLDTFFKSINFVATEDFFLLALPIVWWCVDKRVGASLAVVFLCSEYVGRLLKGITNVPRPYDLEPRIRNLDPQPDLSFPSAGALDAMIFWGYLAVVVRRRALTVAATVVVASVVFTRIYLGVHYPTDVIASIFLGVVILCALFWLRLPERIARLRRAAQWMLAIIVPIVLAAVRFNQETAVTLGALFGSGIGLIIEEDWLRFEAKAPFRIQLVKLVVGFAVALLLRFALKALFPAGEIFTFARYAFIGLWMSLGAPFAFSVLHLSKPNAVAQTAPASVASS